jgi:hypothetical protein
MPTPATVLVAERREVAHVILHSRFADLGRVHLAPFGEECGVTTQVAAVRRSRVRREPALDREPILVLGEQPRQPGHENAVTSSARQRRHTTPDRPTLHGLGLDGQAREASFGALARRFHERREQWVRTIRPALELRVGLGGDEERMGLGRELDELDEQAVG